MQSRQSSPMFMLHQPPHPAVAHVQEDTYLLLCFAMLFVRLLSHRVSHGTLEQRHIGLDGCCRRCCWLCEAVLLADAMQWIGGCTLVDGSKCQVAKFWWYVDAS